MTALTVSELATLRSQPHRTNLYLSIYRPKTLLYAQVTGTYSTGDTEITYYSAVSGTYLNLYADQTVLIGTAPNKDEYGRLRLRYASGTYVSFAENGINWQTGMYLSFLDYVDVQAVYPKIIQDPNNEENVIFYKDGDIAYTNQNSNYGTFPCAGPHRALFIESGTATSFWTATGTYNVASSTPLTYSWNFEGGSPTGSTAHTPGNVTYSQPGHYRTRLVVTAANGATDTTYRYVSVYNRPWQGDSPPILKWELQDFSGSRNEGGYNASFKVYENLGDIQPNALVVIFSETWYGGTKTSLGGNAQNQKSIVFVGYILKDTIRFDWASSSVEFQAGSVSEVMKAAEGFSVSCESKAAPSTWFELLEMTVPKAIYHYLRWHSTVLKTTDFQYTGDDRLVQYFDADRGSLFDAVDSFMRDGMLGSVVTDRQGKLWAEIHSYGVENPISSIPLRFVFHRHDWINSPVIQERRNSDMSFIELGGIAYYGVSSNEFSALLSNAPSTSPLYYGKSDRNDGLILISQQHLNQISGNYLAHHNTPFPEISLSLAGNYNNLDIAPLESSWLVMDENSSVRGKSIQNLRYVVEGMEWNYNSRDEVFRPDITLTQITTGTAGQTVLIPAIPDDGGFGYPFELPPLPVFGGSNPVGPTIATKVVFHDSNSGLIYTENFDSNNPQYITINSGLSQTQYQGVNFMFTTPNGAFYVGRLGSNNSNKVFIARAPYVGGTFTIIEDETTLAAKNGAGTNLFLHACHYNPNSQEQVCFVYSADGIGSWAYIGANTIFSQGYTFTDLAVRGPADLDEMKYRIRYTKDEWVLFGWRDVFGAPQKVYRLSSGASSLVGSAEIGGIDYSFVFRVPGQEGKLFFFGANGFDGIKRADNNDANTLTVVTTDADVLSSSYAACSTDGMQWMSRWGVGLRGRSTDGGTTWTGLPTLPYGNNYYFAYAGAGASVTSSKWIVAGSIIRFSPDLGQTWMNKEGNSATLIIPPAAALQINDILVVGMPPT